MRIRTQFIISTVVLVLILLLVFASVILTNQWIQDIHRQEELATEIERQAYEMGYMANDYLLYHESQQASRWESKYDSFSNDLSRLEVSTAEQQALLANLETNQQRLKAVFTEVRSGIESAPPIEDYILDAKFLQVSWSRLEVQNQALIFDASRLARLLRDQEDRLRRVTSLVNFVLIGVLGAFLLGNYGLIFRRTLNAIAELQAGTRIIGSGDLDFAIPVNNEDEIGELSRAFNQMTQQLKTVTASRAELEKEINERKQAEDALRESRALLLAITDRIPDGIFLKDRQSRIRMANPATLAIIGKPAEQVIGRDDSEHYADPEVGRAIMENDLRIMDSGRTEVVEETGLTPDGYRTYLSTKTPFRDAEGQVIGLLGVTHDITERKQAEESLRRSEAMLLETGRMAKVGGWELDLQTRQPAWSLETYHIHEVDPSLQPDLEGAIDFYAPEARPQITEAVRRAIEDGQPYDLELPLITAKGRNIWIRTLGQPEFRDGKCVRLFGTFQDITERKQAEVEQVRLASFPERNPNPIIELDYSGDVVYLNPKAREVFPDIAISGVEHPILAGLETLILKFKEGELEKHVIQEVKAGDAYYHQTIVDIPESRRIRLYSIDITARKRAEEALLVASLQKQAAEYARTLIEVSIDPLVTISPEGKITDVNEATIQATGVPRAELVGTDFSSYFTEPEEAERGYKQVFAQGFVTDYPLTIRHRDGHLMDVLYNANLYKDTHGQVLGVFAAARDVTARIQAHQYARSLIEVSIDPLVTISPEGKITDVNEATIQATGVPRAELVGTDFSSYFTEPEEAERGYRQVFAQGFVTDYPLTIQHRDGRLMDVLYNASLYKDTHDSILGVFAAARDVTIQKQAELELKRHRDDLEILVRERTSELEETNRELARSNENLQQFAYVASHDLQEPLRIMSSYSQLLERRYKGRLDTNADDFIAFIVDAAARMQKLITDLLTYSRAGHEASERVEVDCSKVLRKLVAGMADTIESAGATVTYDRLPVIKAHESSLVQLFQNLIGNALKFRGEEPPCIHVGARQADGEWAFSVRDNGIGIEPQYRERIFMIFQRLHPRDKYPGTGIGLSICKKIVENLGGRIWVESEPGQGSTFYFTVPIGKE